MQGCVSMKDTARYSSHTYIRTMLSLKCSQFFSMPSTHNGKLVTQPITIHFLTVEWGMRGGYERGA